MHVVLVAPEIAANTGNIARLCAATNSTLHLVEPLGFRLDDRTLKRAGMDYWQQVEWKVHKSWEELLKCAGFPPLSRVPIHRGALQQRPSPSRIVGTTQSADQSAYSSPELYLATAHGQLLYTEPRYGENDCLVFGRESVGLPEGLLRAHEATTIRIPMWNEKARSLNLSNAVAIVLYEALRQIRKISL